MHSQCGHPLSIYLAQFLPDEHIHVTSTQMVDSFWKLFALCFHSYEAYLVIQLYLTVNWEGLANYSFNCKTLWQTWSRELLKLIILSHGSYLKYFTWENVKLSSLTDHERDMLEIQFKGDLWMFFQPLIIYFIFLVIMIKWETRTRPNSY